jgi:hypothetical protein
MAKRASPERFAAAMAARLTRVVPSGFTVRSNGVSVDVYGAADDRHASAGATIIGDEDGRSLAERIQTAAWAILEGAQDGVMEILRQQWPIAADRRAAEPGARVQGDELRMWFGDENAPTVALESLNLRDVMDGTA